MADVSPEKLLERLARGKSIGAVVLLGTDVYLRDLCRAKIVEAMVPEGARDWAVARFAARESGWNEILGRAQTLPMLAPRQIILVEDAESVEELGDKKREEIVKALDEYLTEPPPFTLLLLEAPALDGRQRFRKLLDDKALIVELAVGRESAAALAMQMAKEVGAELERDAAALLAEILNGEPARMHIELEKLATYVRGEPGGGRICKADVELLVPAARKNTVWELADMLASGKRAEALEFLDNLIREGEPPPMIVGGLAWMYRKLIEARSLPATARGFQAARELHMRPEAAEIAVRQAHRIPKAALLAGLTALAEADSALKSSNPDSRALLEFLVARLSSSAQADTARTA
jgi:DNA polymerase III subunit delta